MANSEVPFSGKYRAVENFHIVLWLVKDLCWCMAWKPLALFMIIPTFIFAVFITSSNRNNRSELFHNLAVLLWILANSTWMIGEFYFHDSLKTIALVFFTTGMLIVGYYYLSLIVSKIKNNQRV